MFDKQNELNNLINLNLAASFRDENESLSKKVVWVRKLQILLVKWK